MVSDTTLKIIAPAKVNLTLQVTGKRVDGYHLLHSIVAFSRNFGDEITIIPSDSFTFTQSGNDTNLPVENENLIVKTAKSLANHYKKNLLYHVHLNKNIPIGAGLGGGSSNAASVIKTLLNLWNITPETNELNQFMLTLGADIPVCYHGKLCIMEGVGELISDIQTDTDFHALLVYPNEFTSTVDVFKSFNKNFSRLPSMTEDLWQRISKGENDLTQSAIETTPIIQDILLYLSEIKDCKLARMSGSGSSCFGLFDNKNTAQKAATTLQKERPDWWIQPVILK